MAANLETFVKQLEDSGIIAPGKLENFLPPKATPKDAQDLARQLVQSKQVTKYQVQEIYQGRAKALILGNYTILEKIGAGGMGQVFKAEHRRMKRVVALKMLPRAVTRDAAAVARFQREVEAAAKLRHGNIVAADDADEANGVHFLVMEYIEGADLSALVKKNGPFSVGKAVNYILQAARGLEFSHKKGVIHRDIKPANLLLDPEGVVKILDMGLARIEASEDAATQAELTGTGAVMGTVDYMAPEQALNTKRTDARSDIYSLGCTLYYLLAGKGAYQGESLMEKLLAHREQPIPSLQDVQASVPEQVDAVFRKMVAKKAEDRYQTMSEIVVALEQCGAGQQTSLSIPQSTDTSPDSDAMTFLRDIPAHAKHKPRATKKAAPGKGGKGSNKLIFGAIGAAFLGAAFLAGVIFKMQTKDGTLVVEVDQPGAVVQVLNEQGEVTITKPGEKGSLSIAVDPGKHRLRIQKEGFVVFAKEFSIESGGKASITATLEPLTKEAVAANIETKHRSATLNDPAFQQWLREVASLPAEKQVDAVSKKLQQLNPGFDGKVTDADGKGTPKIEKGTVTELGFHTDNVTDISPVRALAGLKSLKCYGSYPKRTKFSDLVPLQWMKLTKLDCSWTDVSDLSPLRGMPLTNLSLEDTHANDLSPLAGMPLTTLNCFSTPVSDLSPLTSMATLTTLDLRRTKVTEDGVAALHIAVPNCAIEWPHQGKFYGRPATPNKVVATLNDPTFQQWMKDVAALPAEKQVDAVSKKLQQLNPGFDGKVTDMNGTIAPKIEKGVVTELGFVVDSVTDISPVRALVGLSSLNCYGSGPGKGKLFDLSPLQGMPLANLYCHHTQLSDLLPLEGMALRSRIATNRRFPTCHR